MVGTATVNASQRTCVTNTRASSANAQRNGSPPVLTCRYQPLRPDTWSGRQRYKAALQASGRCAREAGGRLLTSRHWRSRVNGTFGLLSAMRMLQVTLRVGGHGCLDCWTIWKNLRHRRFVKARTARHKMFKKVAGINFTDYLSRVRIERA